MKLKIVTYPAEVLQAKAKRIDPKEISSNKIQKLIPAMFDAMRENSGLGLAAPQIGKSIRLCTIEFQGEQYVLINPKITSKSWRKAIGEEGCLSFPGKFIPVKRSRKVKVQFLNEKGEKIKLAAEGLLAVALQHEIDHLDGILFIEHEVGQKK